MYLKTILNNKTTKNLKEKINPIAKKGYSIGFAPIQLNKINKYTTKEFTVLLTQKDLKSKLKFIINSKKISMIIIRENKTPPTLFGIERKTAYTYRKYHSGWIWIGDII